MVIIFPDLETADTLIRAITATPDGCWLFYDPDNPGWDEHIFNEETGEDTIIHHAPRNQVSAAPATDGRVAIGHHWDTEIEDWLKEYLSEEIDVECLESLPADFEFISEGT